MTRRYVGATVQYFVDGDGPVIGRPFDAQPIVLEEDEGDEEDIRVPFPVVPGMV